MRTDKLIMFDFGGVVEEMDDGSGTTYCYINVLADAIRYATGIQHPLTSSLKRADTELVATFDKNIYDKVFRDINSYDALIAEIAYGLKKLSGRNDGKEYDMAERYIQFIQNRCKLIPVDKSMISLQKALKKECLIGGMTNIGLYWSHRFHELTDCIDYDYTFESFKMGCAKPDDLAFEKVETMSNLRGKSILLFDDNAANVSMAKEYGWCAYQVPKENRYFTVRNVAYGFIHDEYETMLATSINR